MKEFSKILLKEYRDEFKKYKDFLDTNHWWEEVYEDVRTGKLKSSKLDTEVSIIKTVVTGVNKFLQDIGEDAESKPVQDFVKFTSGIISQHIKGIQKYKNENPLDSESTESDVGFHSDLFALITKTKVDLSKLNIDETEAARKSIDLFYGNSKAPLAMRELLCDTFPVINDRTEKLGIDFYAPSINPMTSNELFINMKPRDIPEWDVKKHYFEQEKSTIQFWEEELRKIKNGVNLYGYHLSDWLYWHMNHFKLSYIDDEKGKIVHQPLLRDNEYYFDEMYRKAELDGRVALFMFGTRRFAKSVSMASKIYHKLFTITKCQATIQGFSAIPDLKAIIDYISDSVEAMHPALRIPANSMNLEEGAVLGLKGKKAQDRYDLAKLTVVNLEGGTSRSSTQKTAGSTPDVFVFDEALHKDEKLVTDQGFIRIEDAEVGQMIYDPSGFQTEILEKIDVGVKQLYELEFSNGVKVEACDDHIWEVVNKFNHGKIEYKKTSELIKDYRKYGNRSKYSVRKTDPVQFSKKDVKLDPYYVGLYLGDGITGNATIVTTDEEIMQYLYDYSVYLDMDFVKYKKTDGNRKTGTYNVTIKKKEGKFNKIRQMLREYGIFDQKSIPPEYLFNDYDSRLSLLQGLLDTDGTVEKSGRVVITQVRKNLAEDIRILAESLGISARMVEITVKGKVYYKLSLTTSLPVFRLSRKLKKVRKKISKKGMHYESLVSLVNITPTRKDQAYCIRVSNESKLFLTTMFTVTHNCAKGKCIAPWKAALPSFEGGPRGKWRLTPILSATAGEAALSADAEKMLKDPLAYSIMPMDWDLLESMVDPDYITWERNTFGMFVPAQMSLAAPPKIDQKFSDFLGIDNPALSEINIKVTDWGAAKEFFHEERAKLSNDLAMLTSYQNSFPLETSDCYLTTEVNIFPGLECKVRKDHIVKEGLTGQKYRFHRDSTGEIQATMVPEQPLIELYPYEGGSFDAPPVMLENPLLRETPPPIGLYVIGFDDVKVDKSSGDSVISATVFKRGYEGGEWANRIVGWYDSRPDRKQTYYKQLYLMMKAYNARVLYENADNGFIEYVETHHPEDVALHFSTGVGLASEENMNLNKNRKYGWSPTPHNIYLALQKVVMYTKEENIVIGDQDGLGGVERINHPMLLEEMYKHKKGINADRIRSFSLALTLARYYDNTYQYMSSRRHRLNDSGTVRKKTTRSSYGGIVYDSRLNRRR